MIKYNSDFAKFVPIDIETPEGAEKMKEIIHYMMWARTREPEKEPRFLLRYDEHGIFSRYEDRLDSEHVLVCVPFPEYGKDERCRAFYRKFCSISLKRENGDNRIKIVMHSRIAEMKKYRAVVWIRGDEELPKSFNEKNAFYATDDDGRPVYILGTSMIDACKNKDADSPFVESRIRHVINSCPEREIEFIS